MRSPLKSHDVLIRQVNALPRRRHTLAQTEWQLSRARGAAIARVQSLDEAIAMATNLISGNGGQIYLQPTVGRPQPHSTSVVLLPSAAADSEGTTADAPKVV